MYPDPSDDPQGLSQSALKGLSNVRSTHNDHGVTEWLDAETDADYKEPPKHELDNEFNARLHAKLKSWFEQESERQAVNRFQMAVDEDFYDSLQWSEEDAQVLIDRRQAPLVFNQIKPTIDWLIGTEKRTRMDFKILPREEDDVKGAEAKTKVMKYTSDVNKEPYARSKAFKDAIVAGMGVLESGVRADPTQDPLYDRYEDWRYCLHDSNDKSIDGSEMRYFFRWRWVDTDVAKVMFPDRADCIDKEAIGALSSEEEGLEDFWYLGARPADAKDLGINFNRHSFVNSAAYADNRRERVRLIECWYRIPVREKVLIGGAMEGQPYDEENPAMVEQVARGMASIFDRVTMKVYCAVMTEGKLLQNMQSPYRHNRFPFTIVWGYRRKRDNLPYGVVRAIRDPQEDLNKRISKSLHIMSTKQVIMEDGAVDDLDELREEVAAPDGVIVKNRGRELQLVRDEFDLQHQGIFMERDAAAIREVGGVNSENLGRDTNATSGKAILAKQEQGGMVTAELFDNLMLAFQLYGETKLSLIEQYYTDAKVIRIIGNRGKMEWLKINQPNPENPDGPRLNDITARQADFIVAEQDYRQSVRLAMFETLSNLIGKLPPETAIQFLDLLVEVGDIPEKDEFLRRIRAMNGHTDPDAELSPEEQEEQAGKKAAQEKMAAFAERMALLEAAEKEATVRKLTAEAMAREAEAGGGQVDVQGMLQQQQAELMQQFNDQITALQAKAEQQAAQQAEEIAKLRQEAVNRVADAEAKAQAEHKKNVSEVVKARIQQETEIEVAKINAAAQKAADAVTGQLDSLTKMVQELAKGMKDDGDDSKEDKAAELLLKRIDDLSKQVADMSKAAASAPAAKGEKAEPPVNLTLNVAVDAGGKPVKKTGRLVPDGKGGFTVESQETQTPDKGK